MEIKNESLSAPGKTGRTGLHVDIFRKFCELISDLVSQWFVIDLKANEKNTSAKKKKVPTECDKRPLFQPCKGHCMERMQIPQKAFSQSAEPLDLGT